MTSPPCFTSLSLILDTEPHPAALNMAIDQTILETTTVPVLRVYQWDRPSISIGYSHDYMALQSSLPGWPVVRRWTGGGVVWHQQDSTYSLTVPACDPWSQTRPVESYRQVHGSLAQTLNEAGEGPCTLVGEEDRKEGALCFEAPALFDIARRGLKIAGAGQRRSRLGMLHQGSLKVVPDEAFWSAWAARLALKVETRRHLPSDLETKAHGLVQTRYGTEEWLLRR